MVPYFFDLVTLTLKFGLLLKNFNHGFYLLMVAVPSVIVFWQLLLVFLYLFLHFNLPYLSY